MKNQANINGANSVKPSEGRELLLPEVRLPGSIYPKE
jgi:hypothetical protein